MLYVNYTSVRLEGKKNCCVYWTKTFAVYCLIKTWYFETDLEKQHVKSKILSMERTL